MDETVHAPFSADQVDSLNLYQQEGYFHPFTCGSCRDQMGTRDPDGSFNDRVLIATPTGWVCPVCGYTQPWAWGWMADWRWKDLQAAFEAMRGHTP